MKRSQSELKRRQKGRDFRVVPEGARRHGTEFCQRGKTREGVDRLALRTAGPEVTQESGGGSNLNGECCHCSRHSLNLWLEDYSPRANPSGSQTIKILNYFSCVGTALQNAVLTVPHWKVKKVLVSYDIQHRMRVPCIS